MFCAVVTRTTSLTIRLHCLVNIQREALCNNTHEGVEADPSFTFWSYLAVRTGLGVLTAASLMMFEGAVMATIQVGTLTSSSTQILPSKTKTYLHSFSHTTLQSIMNVKLSRQWFWHCHENRPNFDWII